MATSKEYHDKVMGVLFQIGEFRSRRMMGEYCIYYNGKMVAELCDDRFLLKTTASVKRMMPDAPMEFPYEGAKTKMAVVSDISDPEFSSPFRFCRFCIIGGIFCPPEKSVC